MFWTRKKKNLTHLSRGLTLYLFALFSPICINMSQSLIDKHHPENPKHVKMTLYVQNDSTSGILHENATNEPILYILLQFVFVFNKQLILV